MYYGHAPRRGRRHPAYEWVPSFFPSRRRRKHRPLPTGFGPAPRRSRANPHGLRPREPLSPPYDPFSDSMRRPTLSLVPGSIGEGLAEMFAGAALTAVWLFWQYFLAAGLAVLAVRYLARHLRKQEKHYASECEQAYCACRVNRRNSVNPPPTPAALEAAWAATRGGRRGDPAVLAARLRLGSMLSDLEPIVDQAYIRDETGAIVGRQPGLRGWIGFHTPSLAPHYKALMAYKALADKLRLALQIEEPDTLDNVIELGMQPEAEQSKNSKNSGENDEGPQESAAGMRDSLEDTEEDAEGMTVDSGGTSMEAHKRPCERPCERPRERPRERPGFLEDAPGEARVTTEGEVSNSMQLKCRINVMKSNVEYVKQAYQDMFGAGIPTTMAALEAAVRERLGLAWMQRGGRKPEQVA